MVVMKMNVTHAIEPSQVLSQLRMMHCGLCGVRGMCRSVELRWMSTVLWACETCLEDGVAKFTEALERYRVKA